MEKMETDGIEKKRHSANDEKNGPYGMKGWLLLFWLSLVFFSPLYSVISQYSEFLSQESNMPGLETIPLWGQVKTYSWIHLVCSILLLWVAGYFLNRRYEWKSVKIAILIIWLTGPVAVMFTALYFCVMFPSLFSAASEGLAGHFLTSLVYPVIWTLYLLMSKRVKNTYVKTKRSFPEN